tara:strand:+ start:161 stop:1129 length:969 start_codon:yes stop_codon:yes gene_type:complete
MFKLIKKTIFVIIIIFFSNNFAYSDYYKIGQEIEGEFKFTDKIKYQLDPGVWTVVRKDGWFYGDIKVRMIGIVLLDGDEVVSVREFQEGLLSGSWQSSLNTGLYKYFYLDKYDGCYERTEYTLVRVKKKGSFTNCLVIAHYDMRKEIYTPDDPEGHTWTKNYRKYIKDYNIKLPEIMLGSRHAFFSRTISNNMHTVSYIDNPKYFGGPDHQFSTEESSEYHPSNIKKYPKFQKYMNEFKKISAKRHIEFEKIMKAKNHHELDFSDIGVKKQKKHTNKRKKKKNIVLNNNDNITKQLLELKSLLDQGVISDEEFIKAKKKILN